MTPATCVALTVDLYMRALSTPTSPTSRRFVRGASLTAQRRGCFKPTSLTLARASLARCPSRSLTRFRTARPGSLAGSRSTGSTTVTTLLRSWVVSATTT